MEGHAPFVEATLPDPGDVEFDQSWGTGSGALDELIRELVADARRQDGESAVAAFNSAL
jgi:hypothetical protein